MTRYAEGTDVPVDRSRAEMVSTLSRYGVRKFGWDQQDAVDLLFFELAGKAYRMRIHRPTAQELWEQLKAEGKSPQTLKFLPNDTQVAAEWRRRWRANAMMLKMRLEFAGSGDSSVEMELLPYLLLKTGDTVAEALDGGRLPLLAAGNGR